jgi:hypothetical protein
MIMIMITPTRTCTRDLIINIKHNTLSISIIYKTQLKFFI